MEEKHRQQLKELEEAMKSTWEEKTRLSSGYEKDQAIQAAEQTAMRRKLIIQREKNWQLLEDKNDIDMTLSHVKELLNGVKTENCPKLLELLSAWSVSIKTISQLEQKLGEQDTMVDVYRSALQKDALTLCGEGAVCYVVYNFYHPC